MKKTPADELSGLASLMAGEDRPLISELPERSLAGLPDALAEISRLRTSHNALLSELRRLGILRKAKT